MVTFLRTLPLLLTALCLASTLPSVEAQGQQTTLLRGCAEGLDLCANLGVPPFAGQRMIWGCPLGFEPCIDVRFLEVDVNDALFTATAVLHQYAGPYLRVVCAPLGGGIPVVYVCYRIHCQSGADAPQVNCLRSDNTAWCDVYVKQAGNACVNKYDMSPFGGWCYHPVHLFCVETPGQPCWVHAPEVCLRIAPCYEWEIHPPQCRDPGECMEYPYCRGDSAEMPRGATLDTVVRYPIRVASENQP